MDSILLIEDYTDNMTQVDFFKNRALQDAVIRRLEIIGEAVKNLSMPFRSKHPQIPWKKMAGMRDILTHQYFDVDLLLTWKVAKQELPAIKRQLVVLLKQEK